MSSDVAGGDRCNCFQFRIAAFCELCLYTLPRGLAFAQQIKQIVSESRFEIVFQALARAICLIGSSSIDDSERMCQGS